MKHYTYCDGMSGRDLVALPMQAVIDCSGAGSMDDNVAYWIPRVRWIASDDQLRAHLREYGAWDDLDTADTDTLRSRTLWNAACDIREQPELYGVGRKGREQLQRR